MEGLIILLRRHRTLLALTSGTFILYLLTKTEALSAAHDSRWYLRMIENGEYFHPHHLLYNAISALWAWLLSAVLPGSTLLARVVSLNSLFGALTVGLFFLVLRRRVGVTQRQALIAALLPACSFGLWFYSVTIEVYVIALFFVLAALYVLTNPALTKRGVLLAATLHGLAMLSHQAHLLFLLPALFALGMQRGPAAQSPGARWRPMAMYTAMATYTAMAGAVVLVPYLYVGIVVLGMDTPELYVRWITGYAGDGVFWIPPGIATPLRMFLGFSRTIIGADFLFALPESSVWIQRLLPGKWLADQEFVVRNLPEPLAIALLAASVVAAALLLLLAFRTVQRLWQHRRILPLVLRTSLLFLVVYSAFFAFWDTTNVEFWLPQSLLAWLLLSAMLLHSTGSNPQNAIALTSDTGESSRIGETSVTGESSGIGEPSGAGIRPSKRYWKNAAHPAGRLAFLALLLFVINGAGSIYWMMPRANDYYAVQADSLTAIAGMRGVIVLPDTYMMERYLEPEQISRAVIVSELLHRCDGDAACAVRLAEKRISEAFSEGRRVAVDGQCVAPRDFVALRGGKGYGDFVVLFRERFAQRLQKRPTAIGPMYSLTPGNALHEKQGPAMSADQ